MNCRHCACPLELLFLDLGSAPPSNAYLDQKTIHGPEKWYPLRVLVCRNCWLVQTEDFAGREEFFSDQYAYFSSYSSSWLAHSKKYVLEMIQRFRLGKDSLVVEIAANDGYLLQYVKEAGIPCYGVEPTASTAGAARKKGIEIIERFFGLEMARELAVAGRQADLIVANNVLAHVPDINDFVKGFAALLKPHGVATFEFPHLNRLIAGNQFDTIYHEHFSYLSLTTVRTIFNANGLGVFDVESISTHGGSLRVFAQRIDTGSHECTSDLELLLHDEQTAGIAEPSFYQGFQARSEKIKNDLIAFLLDVKQKGGKVAAYGAAAKGNTLLNFAGIRPDLLPYVVDRNTAKQNMFMPGSRIPVVDESWIQKDRPGYILILPWNIENEVRNQLAYIDQWGGRFVRAVPELQVF